MNIQLQDAQISIADQLLKQLQDQYFMIQSQNLPKQNIEPQQDMQNPYQSLDFEDEDEYDQQMYPGSQNQEEKQQNLGQEVHQTSPKTLFFNPNSNQADLESVKAQLQNIDFSESQSNPEKKQQLMEVLPTNQQIFTTIPHKDFQIDQDKIKSFALQMDIHQPEWLKDQALCTKRIQQLFVREKKTKCFTKI